MPETDPPVGRRTALVELRAAVARLERGGATIHARHVSLCPQIDRVLPEGGWLLQPSMKCWWVILARRQHSAR
jgi:hypothetical protein